MMPAMFQIGAHASVRLTCASRVAGRPDRGLSGGITTNARGTNSGTASPGDGGTDEPCGSIAIQSVHPVHAELVAVPVVMVVVTMVVPVATLPRVHAHGAIHSAIESSAHVAGQSVVCVEVVCIIDAVAAVVRAVASVLHPAVASMLHSSVACLMIATMMATGVVPSATAAACKGCHRDQGHTSNGCGKHGSGHGVRLSDEELKTA